MSLKNIILKDTHFILLKMKE